MGVLTIGQTTDFVRCSYRDYIPLSPTNIQQVWGADSLSGGRPGDRVPGNLGYRSLIQSSICQGIGHLKPYGLEYFPQEGT